ncbi:hypothetical protein Tco_0624475 [Tanacetum coccineum]|uniref:Uncharacterized protein n=1 Tax=Tanacetum coccineum TaxID=301880 RepID=A0ABQ4WE54_9ASTR
MGYFQLIKADGSSKRYSSMIKMLQNIDREDLETLWKLVKANMGIQGQRRHMKECYGNLHIFMLVEKKYPLTPATITAMLNKKLQADHWNEMCYQLLKLMTKLVKNPGSITTVGRVSTVRRIKTRERIKMKIIYQDYLQDNQGIDLKLGSTEFFEGWKPLSPLQLAVEEVMSE